MARNLFTGENPRQCNTHHWSKAPSIRLQAKDSAVNSAAPKPPSIPAPARPMTIRELAANFESEKPERGNLRIAFRFLRFQPTGILRSVRETSPGRIEMSVSLSALHSRRYVFCDHTENTADAPCWVWSPADESAAAVGTNAA